jgi:hypothetical protein
MVIGVLLIINKALAEILTDSETSFGFWGEILNAAFGIVMMLVIQSYFSYIMYSWG